jgi:UDP-glucose-4-epimerase GalE
VLDNLIHGHRAAVKWGPLIHGDMADRALLDELFGSYRVAAVMHFAAFCYVGESVTDPAKYYRNNVAATMTLLDAMRDHGVKHFIFSSSCATYGEPQMIPIPETHPQQPINPYGRTKLVVEGMLADYERAYGLRSVALRYFNAAGADPGGELGEDHRPETHLIPLALHAALGRLECLEVFGTDYPTADGTCIRDYIHIVDLAQAHRLALERLLDGKPGGSYNLGNGKGFSVRQVIDAAERITGRPIPVRLARRRPGDPAELVGASDLARSELGWRPQFADLDRIIATAWNWHRRHPDGFGP